MNTIYGVYLVKPENGVRQKIKLCTTKPVVRGWLLFVTITNYMKGEL
jgi:hypothetical protein